MKENKLFHLITFIFLAFAFSAADAKSNAVDSYLANVTEARFLQAETNRPLRTVILDEIAEKGSAIVVAYEGRPASNKAIEELVRVARLEYRFSKTDLSASMLASMWFANNKVIPANEKIIRATLKKAPPAEAKDILDVILSYVKEAKDGNG